MGLALPNMKVDTPTGRDPLLTQTTLSCWYKLSTKPDTTITLPTRTVRSQLLTKSLRDKLRSTPQFVSCQTFLLPPSHSEEQYDGNFDLKKFPDSRQGIPLSWYSSQSCSSLSRATNALQATSFLQPTARPSGDDDKMIQGQKLPHHELARRLYADPSPPQQ